MKKFKQQTQNPNFNVFSKNSKKLRFSSILGAVFAVLMVTQHEAGSMADTPGVTLEKVQKSQWQKLNEKKIFFGYRSVGRNIIKGMQDLSRENPQIRLNYKTSEDPLNSGEGFFLHYWVDMVESPQSLAKEYANYVDKMVPGKAFDVAMIRFTPFSGKKDIDTILVEYDTAITELKREFPNTVFVHATFPLTHSKETWRTWLKKLFKKEEFWEYDNNVFINKYNKNMREKYKGKEPFFDIAEIQSTLPNGKRSTFTMNGKTYYHMVSDYTNDRTHLNQKGRRVVAEQLLILLVSLT